MIRVLPVTLRVAAVAAVVLATAPRRGAAAPEADPAADLRRAASPATSRADRETLIHRIVESGAMPDADLAVRVSTRLFADGLVHMGNDAVRLLRRALEAGGVSDDSRDAARSIARGFTGEPSGEPMKVDAAGFAILAGVRKEPYRLLTQVSDTPAAREAIAFDAPEVDPAQVRAFLADRAAVARHVEVADWMDDALSDDPRVARPALDALLAAKDASLPYLLAVAARKKGGNPAGTAPRRVRAILVLGMAGDRRARPVLEACLEDDVDRHEDGWVRAAAATALGDLGDPAATVALAHVLFYLGDVHRLQDAWDYPGVGNTALDEEAWQDVEYSAVDEAAADALLRLGVRNAAEWLIRERLTLGSTRWRIRVLQDSADAIRRAFPSAPPYQPDAGLPEKAKAAAALRAWWIEGPRLARGIDASDPGFAAAAKGLVARLGQKSVMEIQIAQRSLALLGSAATPSLLDALAAPGMKVRRAEVTAALGTVRDRAAIGPLLSLTKDPTAHVRAVAAESLAACLDAAKDPLFDGPPSDPKGATGADAIVARWIGLLDDEEEGPRSSAMKALCACPPRADVLQAWKAHASASKPENAFDDYQRAEAVVGVVQTGAGLDAVAAGLADPVLYRRRATWELLVRALKLDVNAFDPTPDPEPAPGQPKAKPVDLAALRAALARRRSS